MIYQYYLTAWEVREEFKRKGTLYNIKPHANGWRLEYAR